MNLLRNELSYLISQRFSIGHRVYENEYFTLFEKTVRKTSRISGCNSTTRIIQSENKNDQSNSSFLQERPINYFVTVLLGAMEV